MMSNVLTVMSFEFQKKRTISAEKLFEKKEKKKSRLKTCQLGENINLSKIESGSIQRKPCQGAKSNCKGKKGLGRGKVGRGKRKRER